MTATARRTTVRLIGSLYRTVAGPLGVSALRQMRDDGLPERFVRPLEWLMTGRCEPHVTALADRIEARRADVAQQALTFTLASAETPHGVARWPVPLNGASGSAASASAAAAVAPVPPVAGSADGPLIGVRWLAHSASVPRRWGVFLHLCADAWQARTILELGANVGVSGAYLASARACTRFITIERSPALAEIARATLRDVTPQAIVLNELFDDGLSRVAGILAEAGETLDLAFIDGHHDEAATKHYVEAVLPRLSPGALIVLDDIYLWAEMWRAWQWSQALPGVTAAVNVGRFGLLVWGGDTRPARAPVFDLSRYTGWWKVGPSRREAIAAGRLTP